MTPDDRKKLYAALSAPFGEEAIERTEGRVTGRGYDTTGLKYQFIVNRLNEVLGIGGWRTEQAITLRETRTAKGRQAFDATCDVTLQFGEWTDGKFLPWAEAFATGGHQSLSEADARKGAFTNGIKKAAAMCGCGKQAYEGTLDDDNVPSELDSQGGPESAQNRQQRRPAPTNGAKPQSPPRQPPASAQATEPAAANNGARASQKQLAVIWSCMRKLGIEESVFRKQVASRFGAEPEKLDRNAASTLIGQLTAKANGAGPTNGVVRA